MTPTDRIQKRVSEKMGKIMDVSELDDLKSRGTLYEARLNDERYFAILAYLDKLEKRITKIEQSLKAEWSDYEERVTGLEGDIDEIPSVVDAIKFRQEQYGWNQNQMAKALDMQKSHYSEFLAGKRDLPIGAIKKAYSIGVPANILLQLGDRK